MSQHWYDRTGQPRHFQDDGKSTTLREARKELLVPSVTTVLDLIAKPQLIAWLIKQAIFASLRQPIQTIIGETEEEYAKRMVEASKVPAEQAASEGTDIHDAISASFLHRSYNQLYEPHVQAVREKIAQEYPDVTDWRSEESFAHHEGFGGSIDLHSESHQIILDIKTKSFGPDEAKRLDWDQHWQLAGYRRGKRFENAENHANLFVSRDHPGLISFKRWDPKKILEGEAVFRACLALWIAIKGYDPSWRVKE